MSLPRAAASFTAILAAAVVSLPAADVAGGRPQGPLAAPDPSNFTDLRLTYTFMPASSYSANEISNAAAGTTVTRSGDFNSAYRISLLAYGPVCSVIPMNCFTPARVAPGKAPPSTVRWGEPQGWDLLGGLEVSYNNWREKGETVAGRQKPDVNLRAMALTLHTLGLGTELACASGWRTHLEANPFLGAGWANITWKDDNVFPYGTTEALSESFNGFYYEAGVRGGVYMTMPVGLQLGGEVRYHYSNVLAKNDYLKNLDLSVMGVSFGFSAGYRF